MKKEWDLDFDPPRPSCAKDGTTAGGRKASWAHAPDSPWEGEGRTPEQPDASENSSDESQIIPFSAKLMVSQPATMM
jgi:hypothetical protein